MTETKRLGRGLGALLGPISREQAEASGALRELTVASVRPNPFQPRTRIDEQALAELTASIEASGLLQPVLVRAAGAGYELIAGERRWRAVQRLGWATVPAVVKEADDQTLLTLALIENLQRNDLSAIDEALGYRRLMQEFEVAQAEVARRVGRNRSTVANLLRLLRLPAEVQALVHEGRLSEGHARALLTIEDETRLLRMARQAADEGWSVRDTEERVRRGDDLPAEEAPDGVKAGGGHASGRRRDGRMLSPDARRVEDVLRKRLGTDVRIHPRRRGRGFLTINYYSNDDLARLLELMLGEAYAG
ncbi:MAG TPA: ParB/RepB/Spo0J family partition protein [Gemmatimonadales bacterium]|nr:ParB/RepB/Spo0J family partition protein [Gemmatimonadales bacterium]